MDQIPGHWCDVLVASPVCHIICSAAVSLDLIFLAPHVVVVKARLPELGGVEVVLKSTLAGRPGAEDQAAAEAVAAAVLPCLPLLATTLASYEDAAGNLFTVTLYGGQTLAQLLAEGGAWRNLSKEERLKVLRKVLGGLVAALLIAEQHGIVHRDIKLENVACQIAGDAITTCLLDYGACVQLDHYGQPITPCPGLLSLGHFDLFMGTQDPYQCAGIRYMQSAAGLERALEVAGHTSDAFCAAWLALKLLDPELEEDMGCSQVESGASGSYVDAALAAFQELNDCDSDPNSNSGSKMLSSSNPLARIFSWLQAGASRLGSVPACACAGQQQQQQDVEACQPCQQRQHCRNCAQCLDLICSMCQLNPASRLPLEQLAEHPFIWESVQQTMNEGLDPASIASWQGSADKVCSMLGAVPGIQLFRDITPSTGALAAATAAATAAAAEPSAAAGVVPPASAEGEPALDAAIVGEDGSSCGPLAGGACQAAVGAAPCSVQVLAQAGEAWSPQRDLQQEDSTVAEAKQLTKPPPAHQIAPQLEDVLGSAQGSMDSAADASATQPWQENAASLHHQQQQPAIQQPLEVPSAVFAVLMAQLAAKDATIAAQRQQLQDKDALLEQLVLRHDQREPQLAQAEAIIACLTQQLEHKDQQLHDSATTIAVLGRELLGRPAAPGAGIYQLKGRAAEAQQQQQQEGLMSAMGIADKASAAGNMKLRLSKALCRVRSNACQQQQQQQQLGRAEEQPADLSSINCDNPEMPGTPTIATANSNSNPAVYYRLFRKSTSTSSSSSSSRSSSQGESISDGSGNRSSSSSSSSAASIDSAGSADGSSLRRKASNASPIPHSRHKCLGWLDRDCTTAAAATGAAAAATTGAAVVAARVVPPSGTERSSGAGGGGSSSRAGRWKLKTPLPPAVWTKFPHIKGAGAGGDRSGCATEVQGQDETMEAVVPGHFCGLSNVLPVGLLHRRARCRKP